MLTVNILILVAIGYVLALFGVAFLADRRARAGRARWLRSPLVYTLSLSVYCTAWTFYGAVGNAARSGLEYLTIYLGPTVVFLGWWWLLRKLVRIGRAERITSIADLISSRYGKSPALAVLVTVLAVAGTTPYIALQLQSVTLSFAVFADVQGTTPWQAAELNATALWVAAGLALFTILFGTRNLDATERHHGVVMAIAVEAVVKLLALLAIGIFVVWGVSGGLSETIATIDASPMSQWQPQPGRWFAMTFLSAAAIICLPRMFQVMVVEYSDETHLRTASWAFPLYLLAMSLFVLPIAAAGLKILPDGANPDLFVLTLPLALGQENLAMFAFLGGFSSATSMVIVASIALATMVSNHIVMPVWLATRGSRATVSGDVRDVILMSRRLSIIGVSALGYIYYRVSGGSTALTTIGLVSFAGVAQVLPVLLGALFWRGATRKGAITGVSVGFAVWAVTLLLPTVGGVPASMLENGIGGIAALRPQALFGTVGLDPLAHAILWSIGLNIAAFVAVSLVTFPTPLERLQAAGFVNIFERTDVAQGWHSGLADTEDLLVMTQRLIGAPEARAIFERAAARQGKQTGLPDPTADFIHELQRELAGSVGAATAHAMIAQINGQASVSVQDLLAVADESAQMLENSNVLEAKSRALRRANDKLTALSQQKDAFLSQVSHELRTPMTSIRSFSEFLMEDRLDPDERARYSRIIHDESLRLTRLLDDLLDLAVLESGQIALNPREVQLDQLIDRAVASSGVDGLVIRRDRAAETLNLTTDADRLVQVFINLISNARKYCDNSAPALDIRVENGDGDIRVDFIDNGTEISENDRPLIFEKFTRLSDQAAAGSAGLGLAICHEVMSRLGGAVAYLPGQAGAAFRVTLPRG